MSDNKRRNFFMADDLYEQLRKHADRNNQTMSDVLRHVLTKYLERQNAKTDRKS